MKLKSLKLAERLFEICLRQYRPGGMFYIDDEAYKEGREAWKDIDSCIKVIDKAFRKEAKKLVKAYPKGTGWTFPIMIDVEYSIEYLKKNMKGK